jgi:heme exporter protein D
MKSFFPLRRGEGATLVFLIAFAAFAFIPSWRTIEMGGMAVFGWLIAALMLISPALALATILQHDKAGDAGAGAGSFESGEGVEEDGGGA